MRWWSKTYDAHLNAINAINLWKNLEIDFKSCQSQEIDFKSSPFKEIDFKSSPSQEIDFKSGPSQELQTGHGSPSTRGAPQGLPAMIMIFGGKKLNF